jgi:hydroxymethylglutaryl-CoA lyase
VTIPDPTAPLDVVLQDVTGRDGFQNVAPWIPTAAKVALLRGIVGAGVPWLEVTSFVHPRWVPQLRDAEDVCAALAADLGVPAGAPRPVVSALVPNARGVLRAAAAGATAGGSEGAATRCIDAVSLTISASEAHARANLNRGRAELLEAAGEAIAAARGAGLAMRGGIATSFGCPIQGDVPLADLAWVVGRYVELGLDVIRLGDTTGMAHPRQVREAVTVLRAEHPRVTFVLHLHDTRGLGIANAIAGVEAGLRHLDAALGGLGGCPYAPGASGNVDLIDLAHAVGEMGWRSGIDLGALLALARRLPELTGLQPDSRVLVAGPRSELAGREVVQDDGSMQAQLRG